MKKLIVMVCAVMLSVHALSDCTDGEFDMQSFAGYRFGDDWTWNPKLDKSFFSYKLISLSSCSDTKKICGVNLFTVANELSPEQCRDEIEKTKAYFEKEYKVKFEYGGCTTISDVKITHYYYNGKNIWIFIGAPKYDDGKYYVELQVSRKRLNGRGCLDSNGKRGVK